MAVERAAQGGDGLRQRVVEVAVAALTEAVARHLDRRPKPPAVEQIGQLRALGGGEDLVGYREATGVELGADLLPVEGIHSLAQRRLGGSNGRHGHIPFDFSETSLDKTSR